jgi:hypothetical protein
MQQILARRLLLERVTNWTNMCCFHAPPDFFTDHFTDAHLPSTSCFLDRGNDAGVGGLKKILEATEQMTSLRSLYLE